MSRHAPIGSLIGGLERHRDIPVRREEEGHIDQRIADADRLDIGGWGRPGVVGGERQRLVIGHRLGWAAELGPDDGMDPLGVAFRPRVEIDQKQMIAAIEGVQRSGDKLLKFLLARLVPG